MIRKTDAKGAKDGKEGVVRGRGSGGREGKLSVESAEANAVQNRGGEERADDAITSGDNARRCVTAKYVHVDLN